MTTVTFTPEERRLVLIELAMSLGELNQVAKAAHDPDETRAMCMPAMRDRALLIRKIKRATS